MQALFSDNFINLVAIRCSGICVNVWRGLSLGVEWKCAVRSADMWHIIVNAPALGFADEPYGCHMCYYPYSLGTSILAPLTK